MQKASIYIMFVGTAICATSVLYFLSLILHLPYLLCFAAVLIAVFVLFRWFNGINTAKDISDTNNIPFYILIAALIILINKANDASTKYGAWDAWAIWNLHARYLTDAAHWKNMLLNKDGAHPDYPLNLPGFLAFTYKTVGGGYQWLVTYTFHATIMLLIPVLIFLQTYKRSLFAAGILLFFFATDAFYTTQSTYLIADNVLAFYFLSAMIAIYNYENEPKMIAVCAAMLGTACWTKNEGIVLALLFVLFYAKVLFSKKYIRYTIAGFVVPVLVLCIFKGLYAPANDIVAAQDRSTLSKITDLSRYPIIARAFVRALYKSFYWPACTAGLYVLVSLLRKKPLPRALLLILACTAAYLFIYVITPLDLQWHLNTSIDRVLHQLMPATMYILLMHFTNDGGAGSLNWRTRFSSFRPFPQ